MTPKISGRVENLLFRHTKQVFHVLDLLEVVGHICGKHHVYHQCSEVSTKVKVQGQMF